MTPPPDADEPTSLLEPNLHPVEAARRLLTVQFNLIRRNVPGTLRSTSTRPLHDLRVAMRRFRTVIRLFRRQLAGTSATEISGELQQIMRTLGPARDLDVWIEYLETPSVRRAAGSPTRFQALIDQQKSLRARLQPGICRTLHGRQYHRFVRRTERLLQVELPQKISAENKPKSLAKLARRRFARGLKQVKQQRRLRHSSNPEKLHRLRGALRRARYVGELFHPLLSPSDRRLTKRLHQADGLLGRVHDVDAGLRRISERDLAPPPALVKHMKKQRAQRLASLRRRWKTLLR